MAKHTLDNKVHIKHFTTLEQTNENITLEAINPRLLK